MAPYPTLTKENLLNHFAADWSLIERRPTWGYISVQEASQILNISPQSVHNNISRGYLPKLERKTNFRGNKGFFQIARLRSYLEQRPVDDIHWEWIRQMLPDYYPFTAISQAQLVVKICYEQLGVEKP